MLPSGARGYRSVVTHDLIANLDQVIEHMTVSGCWYFDDKYKTPCYQTAGPLFVIPGSGIQAGDPMPDHALDSLFVADAMRNPHLMAYDEGQFQREFQAGRFLALATCPKEGCRNLCAPERKHCVLHDAPPLVDTAK